MTWLLYNLFGATVPIWLGGYILLPVFGQHFSWVEYSKHGELVLYSAAFLAPTLRLISRDVEDSVFVRRQMFLLFGWIPLMAAVALYSGIVSSAQMPVGVVQVNFRLLSIFSISLLIFSVIFSSLVRLIDFGRIPAKQIFAIQHEGYTHLESEFDATAKDEPFTVAAGTDATQMDSQQAVAPPTQNSPAAEHIETEDAEQEGSDGTGQN